MRLTIKQDSEGCVNFYFRICNGSKTLLTRKNEGIGCTMKRAHPERGVIQLPGCNTLLVA